MTAAGARRTTAPRRSAALAVLVLPVLVALVAAAQLLAAAPASAHAELVRSTPSDGALLADPPAVVTLTFTEPVDLLDGGLRLLDAGGAAVDTGQPEVDGTTVRWPMPADLPDGGYVASWRVVSSDGHPVAGAFSFAVGAGAAAPVVSAAGGLPPEAPWPVVLVRLLGYLGFAAVAGPVAVALLCWPEAGRGGRPLHLLRWGLVGSAVTAALALLLQGPYTAGEPLTRLFDRTLLVETAHTDFAAWAQLRLFFVLAIASLAWARGSLDVTLNRWFAVGCVLGAAVTFSGTGHAAASGTVLARATDSLHVLLAGTWVGGLAVLALALAGRPAGDGARPGPEALTRFSRLALLSVAGILVTGTVNAVLRLPRWSALWDTRYGVVLLVKLALVALVLGIAAASRRAVRRGVPPRGSITAEVVVTVLVLAVTSLLASTVPPTTVPATAASGSRTAPADDLTRFDLGAGRTAVLAVTPTATADTRLRLQLRSRDGAPLDVRSASLRAELPDREVAALEVPLRGGPATWTGRFRFPFPGSWRLTLTVELPDRTAVVTAGTLRLP